MIRESHEESAKLVLRCRLGDERAWSKLVDRYRNLVYSIPRRMGLGREDADEVFQATWVALYKGLDRLEDPATVGKWLAVTASRECLRVIRTRAKQPGLLGDAQNLDELLASEDQTAEDNALEAEEADHVREAVNQLGAKCRELLTLLYLADEPKYQEIATRLGIAIGSIGPTRARCLEKLRSELGKTGFFSDNAYQTAIPGAPTKAEGP